MDSFINTHNHIAFKRSWNITGEIDNLLGQCESLIDVMKNIPIHPDARAKFKRVSLIKGAHATTAIEGNTLSIEDIQDLQEKKKMLPPSKLYLQKEVENIIYALNEIGGQLLVEDNVRLICPDLLTDFHQMVGKDIGEAFDAEPGHFRRRNVIVSNYKPPQYEQVPAMIDNLCSWLRKEFHFEGEQSFSDAVIEAIVTHVYIAWIHPFSDGNGRTARLVEFYLLLRAGLPDIATHILSNFYNQTRAMYYSELDKANRSADLTSFIRYAVEGFRDGLKEILEEIQDMLIDISWKNLIFESFDENELLKHKTSAVKKRMRILMLNIDSYDPQSQAEIRNIPALFDIYKNISLKQFTRDLSELVNANLLEKSFEGYRGTIEQLFARMPKSR